MLLGGIAFATLSALSVAFMVQLDRIMMIACYNYNPRLAWYVTALGGIGFGLPLTLGFGRLINEHYLTLVWEAGQTYQALALFVSGIIAIQVMKHYFVLFIPKKGESVNETGITMWLATTPFWVFVTLEVVAFWEFIPTQATNFWFSLTLIVFTIGAIVMFESLCEQVSLVITKGRTVALMVGYIVGYSLILDTVLDEKTLLETLVLMPFFWLGYALGARDLLFLSGRAEWRSGKLRLRYFFKVILVAEFLGALVFYFEVLAYFELSATAINLFSAGAVVPTFLLAAFLGRKKVSLWVKKKADNKRRYLGVLIDPSYITNSKVTNVKIKWLLIVTALLVITILTLL